MMGGAVGNDSGNNVVCACVCVCEGGGEGGMYKAIQM